MEQKRLEEEKQQGLQTGSSHKDTESHHLEQRATRRSTMRRRGGRGPFDGFSLDPATVTELKLSLNEREIREDLAAIQKAIQQNNMEAPM